MYTYVNPSSSSFSYDTVRNKMIATASFIMPYPKSTALRTGYLSGLIRDMAATVSVAHRTLLTISTSSVDRVPRKTHLLRQYRMMTRLVKPIRVPTMPKKLMMPKFSKKRDLRRE